MHGEPPPHHHHPRLCVRCAPCTTHPPSAGARAQMPYLLTPEAKYRIIQGEAMLQKREHMSHGAMQARSTRRAARSAGLIGAVLPA